MNVLHVNYSDTSGGAARAAWRLNEGLRSIGVDSRMVVRDRAGDPKRALLVNAAVDAGGAAASRVLLREAHLEISRNRTAVSNTLFSFDAPGLDLTAISDVLRSDVVNLHWTSFFLSPYTVSRLADSGPPIVWTLHDQWAFTGGCHYSAGCVGYQSDCSSCPQLLKDTAPLAAAMLAEKQRTYGRRPVVIVAPSGWMAECARSSSVLAHHRIEVIPNGVELERLRPGDKLLARRTLGLPEEGFLLLFGADHGTEKRKGFEVVAHALRLAATELTARGTPHDWHLAYFGRPAETMDQLRLPAHALGYVEDEERLRLAYCAADLFVLPSLEDNLPNTMIESMACATPVLASAFGGMAETIRDGENGMLAATGSATEFANAMLAAAANRSRLVELGKRARVTVETEFTLRQAASRYLSLYRDLTVSKPSGRAVVPFVSDVAIAPEVAGTTELLADDRFIGVMQTKRIRPDKWVSNLRMAGALVRGGRTRDLLAYAWQRVFKALGGRGSSGVLIAEPRIALGNGFLPVEGPYPRLRLPRLTWIEARSAQLLVRQSEKPEELLVDLQLAKRATIHVRCGDYSIEECLDANFCNRRRDVHRVRAPLATGAGWITVDITFQTVLPTDDRVALLLGASIESATQMSVTHQAITRNHSTPN